MSPTCHLTIPFACGFTCNKVATVVTDLSLDKCYFKKQADIPIHGTFDPSKNTKKVLGVFK
jgi:hypothetical protein